MKFKKRVSGRAAATQSKNGKGEHRAPLLPYFAFASAYTAASKRRMSGAV
jgi:hypothetical protein